MAISPGQKKLLTYGVPIVAALALFVYLRSRNSSATTATTTGTTTASDTAVGLDQLTNFENALQGEVQQLAGLVTSGTTTAAPPPNATPAAPTPAAAPAPTPGFGEQTINGTTYTLLGITSSGRNFEGYQVGGGAPVYFEAPGSKTPTQGLSQAVTGAEVLVPSIYNGLVSTRIFPAA